MSNDNDTYMSDEEEEEMFRSGIIGRAFKEAAENAMRVAGSVVSAKDGWLVRIYTDGSIVKLHKIADK